MKKDNLPHPRIQRGRFIAFHLTRYVSEDIKDLIQDALQIPLKRKFLCHMENYLKGVWETGYRPSIEYIANDLGLGVSATGLVVVFNFLYLLQEQKRCVVIEEPLEGKHSITRVCPCISQNIQEGALWRL